MASRTTLRTWIRNWLGADSDDPAYGSGQLDPLLDHAHLSLVAEIHRANPGYLSKATQITSASNAYALAGQADDFARVLELRTSNASGPELSEIPLENLNAARGKLYAVSGEDAAATINTSSDVSTGTTLYLRYAYWPAAWAADANSPTGIPAQFHDLVGLEAAVLGFALGGEAEVPPKLEERWKARRAEFLAHISARSSGPKTATLSLRPGMRRFMRMVLGVPDTDPVFTDPALNLALQQAHESLWHDAQQANPGYVWGTTTLAADAGGDGHTYTLNTQSTPVADFVRHLELRLTNAEGSVLTEARPEELRAAGGEHFNVKGEGSTAVITTSPDTDASVALWLRYLTKPDQFTSDTAEPALVPRQYQEVLPLEALGLVAAGRIPKDLRDRWQDRRAQFLAHVGRRGTLPSRTRRYNDD